MNSAQIRLALLAATTGLLAVLMGAAVAILPPILSLAIACVLIAPVALLLLARAPEMTEIPSKLLSSLFIATIFLYFIWPRNAFIPISALPIKHPQKMLHLALLSFYLYCLIKCQPLRDHVKSVFIKNKSLFFAWLMLAIWQLLSILTSEVPALSLLRWTNDFITLYMTLPLMVGCITTPDNLKQLIISIIAAGFINVVYAAPEVIFRKNIFEKIITLSEIDPVTAKQIIAAKLRGGSYRAQASFDHPILFAEYLCLTLPFAVTATYFSKRKVLGLIVALALLAGLAVSQSRTATVAGAAAFSITAIMLATNFARNSQKAGAVLSGTLILSPILAATTYITVIIIGDFIVGRSHVESGSTSARVDMLYEGIKLAMDSPLLGFGQGLGPITLNFTNGDGLMTLDNFYLILVLDGGFPALLLFLAIIFMTGKKCWSSRNDMPIIGYATLGSLVAFTLIKSILGTNLNNVILPLLMGTCMLGALATDMDAKTNSTIDK